MVIIDDIIQEDLGVELDAQKSELALVVLLKEHRKDMKLSQEEVAAKSGLTRQMVSKVETYTSNPTLTTMIKYLKGLDIELKDIIEKAIEDKKTAK